MRRLVTIFPQLLTEIDQLTRQDNAYLDGEDRCYYLGEYTSGTGFKYSDTNDLISNLKKPMDRKNTAEWQYKELAISKVAKALRNTIAPQFLNHTTFVPIPPSKAKGDPSYDDRLIKILESVRADRRLDIRELIVQSDSTKAAHTSTNRIALGELCRIYDVDSLLTVPPPKSIAIFDDLLTTGAHYRAAKFHLQRIFSEAQMFGIFVARRVFGPQEGPD